MSQRREPEKTANTKEQRQGTIKQCSKDTVSAPESIREDLKYSTPLNLNSLFDLGQVTTGVLPLAIEKFLLIHKITVI